MDPCLHVREDPEDLEDLEDFMTSSVEPIDQSDRCRFSVPKCTLRQSETGGSTRLCP